MVLRESLIICYFFINYYLSYQAETSNQVNYSFIYNKITI